MQPTISGIANVSPRRKSGLVSFLKSMVPEKVEGVCEAVVKADIPY